MSAVQGAVARRSPGARARLMMWCAGTVPQARAGGDGSGASTPTLVTESASALLRARRSGLVTDATTVFAPEGTDGAIGCTGSLTVPGSELRVGDDFYLQVQGYSISEYVSVVGPTIIRIADAEDLAAFSADVLTAVRSGAFPEFLSHPLVQLADLPALGVVGPGAGPRARLWLSDDGTVAVSPSGVPIGDVDATLDELEHVWRARVDSAVTGDPTAIAGVVPEDVRAAALAERPEIVRFCRALDGLRNLRARKVPVPRVSGFGGTLGRGLEGHGGALDQPDAPFVAWSDDQYFLLSADGNRVFAVDRATAEAVEAVIVTGPADQARALLGDRAVDDVLRLLAGAGLAGPGAAHLAGAS